MIDSTLYNSGEVGSVMVLSSQWMKNPKLNTFVCPATVCGNVCGITNLGMGYVEVFGSTTDSQMVLVNVYGFGQTTKTILVDKVTGIVAYGQSLPKYL